MYSKKNILSIQKELSYFSPSEKECLIILLLKEEPLKISSLSKKAALTRTTCYKLLSQLESKGLTRKQIHGKSVLYSLLPAQELLVKLENSYKETQIYVREHLIIKALTESPVISIQKGEKAILAFYDNLAKETPKGSAYYRYTSKINKDKQAPEYTKLKDEKELERLVITSEALAKKKDATANRFIKVVPKDFPFEDNVSFVICGDTIAHIDFSTNTIVTVKSKTLAHFQEKIFKLLWRRL